MHVIDVLLAHIAMYRVPLVLLFVNHVLLAHSTMRQHRPHVSRAQLEHTTQYWEPGVHHSVSTVALVSTPTSGLLRAVHALLMHTAQKRVLPFQHPVLLVLSLMVRVLLMCNNVLQSQVRLTAYNE